MSEEKNAYTCVIFQLFRNILLWNGLLQDDTLQELGLGKLLNRYLMIALFNAVPGPEVVKKCIQVSCLGLMMILSLLEIHLLKASLFNQEQSVQQFRSLYPGFQCH